MEIDYLYSKLNEVYEALVKLSDLQAAINEVALIDKELYTEETVAVLEKVLERANTMLVDKSIKQEAVDSMVKEIYSAIDNLEMNVDLNEVINVPDRILRDAIKETLELTSNTITIGDMYRLTSLNGEGLMISSLEGLQYAKNLETLNLNYNEIQDLSQLSSLRKLTDISVIEQYIAVGMAYVTDGKVTIDEEVIDITGEKMMPKKVLIANVEGSKTIDAISVIEDNKISIDKGLLYSGVNSVSLIYQSLDGKYEATTIYMLTN